MERRRRNGELLGTASLRQRIERWREAGRPGKRMPEELWRGAIALARERGVNPVASDLGLNYHTLKQRLVDAPVAHGAGVAGGDDTAEFIEVDVAGMREVWGATEITLERSDGCRLRLRLGAGERVDVGAVTAAFIGRA